MHEERQSSCMRRRGICVFIVGTASRFQVVARGIFRAARGAVKLGADTAPFVSTPGALIVTRAVLSTTITLRQVRGVSPLLRTP